MSKTLPKEFSERMTADLNLNTARNDYLSAIIAVLTVNPGSIRPFLHDERARMEDLLIDAAYNAGFADGIAR